MLPEQEANLVSFHKNQWGATIAQPSQGVAFCNFAHLCSSVTCLLAGCVCAQRHLLAFGCSFPVAAALEA